MQQQKDIKMKTVKTYMVRKPSDLDEVKSTNRSNSDRLETVVVVETINLTPAEHKKYAAMMNKKANLNQAFKELRKLEYFVRQNFMCC